MILKRPHNTVSSSSAWLIAERLIRLFGGMFVVGLMARHLGPNGFGELNYIVSLLSVLQIFSNLALDEVIFRELALRRDRQQALLLAAILLRSASSAIAFIGGLIYLRLFGESDQQQLLYLYAAPALFASIIDAIALVRQSASGALLPAVLRTVSFACASAIRIAMVALNAPLSLFGAAVAIEAWLYGGMLVSFVGLDRAGCSLANIVRLAARLASECPPHLFAGLSVVFALRIDHLMLAHLDGMTSLGAYAAAASIALAGYALPSALSLAMSPKLMQSLEEPAEYRRNLQGYINIVSVFAIAYVVLLLVCSVSLLPRVFGPTYGTSGHLLRIYAISSFFVFMGSTQGNWFVAQRQHRALNIRSSFLFLAPIFIHYPLIDWLGGRGAAWSQAIFFATAFFLLNVVVARDFFRMQCTGLAKIPSTLRSMLRWHGIRENNNV